MVGWLVDWWVEEGELLRGVWCVFWRTCLTPIWANLFSGLCFLIIGFPVFVILLARHLEHFKVCVVEVSLASFTKGCFYAVWNVNSCCVCVCGGRLFLVAEGCYTLCEFSGLIFMLCLCVRWQTVSGCWRLLYTVWIQWTDIHAVSVCVGADCFWMLKAVIYRTFGTIRRFFL